MYDNKTFYHGITRKLVIAFGVMFNNIFVKRRDSSNSVIQTIQVPLAYAGKDKMLARIFTLPNSDLKEKETTLPRMSFEIIAFEYDGLRKTNSMNHIRNVTSQTQAKMIYGPTPYNLTMSLYVYTKNQDDGLQIFEQIVPAFNPDFNVTVNYIPELNIQHDLPIILNSISFEDDYEGDMTQRRSIIWIYTFTLKTYYYGPIENQNIIRTAITNIFNDVDFEKQLTKYTITTDPSDALPEDDFDFVKTTVENFSNG